MNTKQRKVNLVARDVLLLGFKVKQRAKKKNDILWSTNLTVLNIQFRLRNNHASQTLRRNKQFTLQLGQFE